MSYVWGGCRWKYTKCRTCEEDVVGKMLSVVRVRRMSLTALGVPVESMVTEARDNSPTTDKGAFQLQMLGLHDTRQCTTVVVILTLTLSLGSSDLLTAKLVLVW